MTNPSTSEECGDEIVIPIPVSSHSFLLLKPVNGQLWEDKPVPFTKLLCQHGDSCPSD